MDESGLVAAKVASIIGDGREAARHIHTAIGLLGPRPRKPSPFRDDDDE
ncbi:MAG TPA: hypothetical protein VHG08_00610 [Longimicrobium sp.]|nr:hypothetical protein [Longimicrobium sp.]